MPASDFCGALWAITLSAAAVIFAVGCGSGERLEQVSGLVVFADGRPVAGGVVEFKPIAATGRGARGAIGPDGRFELKSGAANGAQAGRYHVAVVQGTPAMSHTRDHAPLPRIHPRYSRFDTSGLMEDVKCGTPTSSVIVVEQTRAAAER
jgi:hypothetical protein